MPNQSHAALRIACALLLGVALAGVGCGGGDVPAGYGVGVAGAAGTAAGGMTGAAGDGGVAGGIAGATGVAGAAGSLAGAAGDSAGSSGLAGAAGGSAGASGLAGTAGGSAGASGLAGGSAGATGLAGAAGGGAGSTGLAGAGGGGAGATGIAGAAGSIAGSAGLAGAAGGLAGSSGLAGAAGGLAGSSGLAGAAGGVAGSSGLAGAAGGLAGSSGLAGAAGGLAGSSGLAGAAGGVAGSSGLAGAAGGVAGSSGLAGAAGGLAGHGGAAGIAGSGAAGATACTLDPTHNGSGSFTYYWFGQNPASEPPGYRTACGYYGTASGTTDTVENIANTAPAKNTYFAAIPGHNMFDAKTNCGACVQITGPNGKTIIATIVDECPYGNDSTSGSNEPCASNPTGHLDLSRAAFDQLGYSSGNPGGTSWKIVPCPVSGNVKVRFKQGNDNEIFIENGVTSFSTVTINGLPAMRQRYGAWHLDGAIMLPAAIHTVDRYGRALDFTLASSSTANQDTGKQLPACQ